MTHHHLNVRATTPAKELIIGMDGFIGRHLAARLPEAQRTSRRNAALEDPRVTYFDLLKQGPLPDADIVYLCAGVNGTLTCANDPQRSYRINVDGTIYVAEHYRDRAHVVWISSTTVEWLTEHYGRQKRTAENHLRTLPHVGMARAGRVLQSNVGDLCDFLIGIGRERRRGVFLWGEDERPYQH